MLKAVFFDLDGTLLPMNEKDFIQGYFGYLYKKVEKLGYEKEKLIDTIWKGTYMMVKNDGSKTNEEVFWNLFASVYGREKLKDKPIFDDFYKNEFKNAKSFCKENPLAKEIVEFCKTNVQYTILSTNPFFPRIGQQTRLSFINLKDTDFDYVTDYSNSSFCKPNPKYFQSLLDKFSLKPEEVILFGNNAVEDGDCSYSVGIKAYMVKGFIIDDGKAKHTYENIGMDQIIPTIKKEIENRK